MEALQRYGVCSGAAMPILQSTLLRTVPPELAGAATSTKLIGADIGLMVGNMLMGTIAVAVGQGSYRTSYLILSVVPIIALVFILIYAFFYNRKYPDGRLGW